MHQNFTAKECSLAVSGYRRVGKRRGLTSINCALPIILMFTDCIHHFFCSVMSPGSTLLCDYPMSS